MATEISRDLREINDELLKTDAAIKKASSSAAYFQRALKSDPQNQNAQTRAIESLSREIELCAKKADLLREKQARMLQANGPAAKLTPEYKALEDEIAKCDATTEQLEKQMKRLNGIDFTKLKSGAAAFTKTLKQGLATTIGIYGAVIAIGKTFSDQADEIAKASAKWGETAEQWQRNQFVWDKLTGDSEAYASALSAVASLEGQALNETDKLANKLAMLGLSFDDLKGKSPSDALQIILDALKAIEDETERTAIAINLFGQSAGMSIAQMANASSSELASFNESLEKTGILTNEEVEAGAKLHDTFEDVTKSIRNMMARMGDKLVPMVETLLNTAMALTPVLEVVADALNSIGPAGAIALATFIGLASAIPGLVMMLIALNVAAHNIAIAAAATAALAAATAVVVGFTASANIPSNSYTPTAGSTSLALEEEASGLSSSSSGTRNHLSDGSSSGEGNTYVDNSQYNVTVTGEADEDRLVEKITTAKRSLMRGGTT